MRRLFESQRGSAVVTSMAVMTGMLGVGLATFATVDVQQTQSGRERTSEGTFNVAEAALNTQVFVLSRNWPGSAGQAYASTCSNTSGGNGCPDSTRVLSNFGSNIDVAGGNATWTTQVRDDGASNPNFYDDPTILAQPTWDANKNDRVWVRSQGVVRGVKRTIAALVKVDIVQENMARNAVTAGNVTTNNNGNKTIIDTKGRPLALRCRSENNPRCAGFRNGQVKPPGSVQQGYTGGTALSPDAIDRLKTRAKANGTYYASGCPSNPAGEVVFVEDGDCSYTSGTANSMTAPGALVIMRGTLYLGGNFEYYGIVYMGNLQGSTGNVITMRGTALIWGGVAIDGDGVLEAGASKENVIFNDLPFNNLRSYGSAGIVQNSWRELDGG